MRKFVVTILSALYITSATGASIHMHYCMGKLTEWSYWNKADKKTCVKCGMEKENSSKRGCCKDEHKWIKIQDDQKANYVSIYLSHLQPAEAVSFPVNLTEQFFANTIALLPQSNAPPRTGDVAIYKRNCVFRI